MPSHQNIYFYTVSDDFTFNPIYTPYSETTNIDQIFQNRIRDKHNKTVYELGENGKFKHGKQKKGVPLNDVWEIPYLNPKAKERARALQAQAMRLSDNADLGKVSGLTNESLRLKNAYGVSEMGSLALNTRLRRFKGQEGAANIAIAIHQASKQDNSTIDESIQAILQNFNSKLSQSIAVSADNIAQGIGSLSSSLQYRISGKNYSTLDAARMANRLDHGFASAPIYAATKTFWHFRRQKGSIQKTV